MAFDTETTGLDAQQVDLVGICMSVREGTGCYIPTGHSTSEPQLPLQTVIDYLRPVLESPVILKVLHNAKYDMAIMHRYGIELTPIADTMLMSNSMFGGLHRHGMDECSARYLRYQPIKFTEVVPNGTTFADVSHDAATAYAAEDGDVTLRLHQVMRTKLAADPAGMSVYTNLELPLVPVIARMERTGIKADVPYLGELTKQFTHERDLRLDMAESLAGIEFNPASPLQVGEVLKRMGVALTETTESGQTATGVKVLEDVLETGELPDNGSEELIRVILDWRKFNKLIGTYTEALPTRVNPHTGRIHPSFGMASTTTGRLACSEPNLQNIPARTAEGKLLRNAFVAEPGHKLISADYSQIELRVLAHATGDPNLLGAFDNGIDIHTMTAALVNDVTIEAVTKDMRRDAKAVNFGIVYGISGYGLARQLKISVDDADRLIAGYFRRFGSIQSYMERAKEMARQNGYVMTMAGRKVWAPDINSGSRARRRYAERAVVNAPIQGTAADIIKEAMIKVDAMLAANEMQTRLLLQVHDELVFEAPDREVAVVLPMINECMESVADYIDVPLVVDAKSGATWGDAH